MIAWVFAACVAAGAPASYAEIDAAETDLELPVREARPWVVGAEASYNGLGGLGLMLSYELPHQWAVDSAVGASRSGVKLGVRARYNFFDSAFTPFVAAGVSLGLGSFNKAWVDSDSSSTLPARYTVALSPFANAALGLAYVHSEGYSFMLSLGWSQLMRQKNITWLAAPLPQDQKRLSAGVNSGLLASVSAGYAF